MHQLITVAESSSDTRSACLSFLEFSNLPWIPKRAYWLKNFKEDALRGNHAHKSLSQLFILLSGRLVIELYEGEQLHAYKLGEDSPQLLVSPGYWRVIKSASPDAVLLVLADSPYEESDYIRDWDEYLQWFTGERNE